MSDKKQPSLPFDSDDPTEQKLWSMLQEMPQGAPSADMRRTFYRELENANTRHWSLRLREWLGISGNAGWLTAATCVLLGAGLGQSLSNNDVTEPARLAALEENIAMLNRELILDRLEDAAAGKRLRGVIDAGNVVGDDVEIARALLTRATEDRVSSVRTAAISALGPRMASRGIGDALMALLADTESPLVQLALIDLVLRNGSAMQLRQLLQFSEQENLHPDLAKHINLSLGSETI